jgi:hypothetical protein
MEDFRLDVQVAVANALDSCTRDDPLSKPADAHESCAKAPQMKLMVGVDAEVLFGTISPSTYLWA